MKQLKILNLTLILLVILSCNKDEKLSPAETQKDNRVNQSGLIDPTALMPSESISQGYTLIWQVAELERQHQFMGYLSQRIGEPLWHSSLIYKDTSSSKEIIYLPFGFYKGYETKAVLIGVRNTNSGENYNLQLILRSDIANYENVTKYIDEYTLDIFTIFDKEIFGNTSCLLCDYFDLLKRVNQVRKNTRECHYLTATLCFDYECIDPVIGSGTGDGTGGWFDGGGAGYGSGRPNIYIYTSGGSESGGGSGGGGGTSGGDYPDGYKKPKKVNVHKSCPKFKIKGEINPGSRSTCTHCGEYIIKICDDNPNWWNEVWDIQPCTNCDNTATPLSNSQFEQKCKANKNAFIKAKYKLPYTVSYINNSVEGSCDCIGNNNYETCVLNTLLLENIQSFIGAYPILVPGTSGTYYSAQQLVDLGIIPFNCMSSGNFEDCAISHYVDFYVESLSSTSGVNITESNVEDVFDRYADCVSFEFEAVSQGGLYQSCAVIGIDIDWSKGTINGQTGKWEWQYVNYIFNTLYFEFPRIRKNGNVISAGQAGMLCAKAVDQAETIVEEYLDQYGKFTGPGAGVQLEKLYLKTLNKILFRQGGRVSPNSWYGQVPLNPMGYNNFNNGNCF